MGMPRVLTLLPFLLGGLAAAHGGEDHAAGFDWPVALGLLALALAYALGLRILWRRAGVGGGVAVWRALAFAGGVLALALALLTLDPRADGSLAWHMLQHMLLIVVAAPLLVLGTPLYVLGWTLPLGTRRAAARAWNRSPGLPILGRGLTHPVLVWVLATAVFWGWHVPRLYEAAADNGALHALEHLSFLGSSGLFWWALLQPQGRRTLARGAGVVYLFMTVLQGSLMGALLVFSRAPLYPEYAAHAVAEGRSPLADQQLAGLVMWVPFDVVYLALAGAFFVQWWRDEEAAQRRRDPSVPSPEVRA